MDKQFTESGIREIVDGVLIYNNEDSFPSQYLGQNISKVPDLCKQADPTTYITSKCPPFLIQHGTMDAVVSKQQSVDLAAAITKEIGKDKVTLILLEGAGHDIEPFPLLNGTINCGGQFDTAENMDKVFAFLNRYMK